MQGTRMIKAI